MEATAMWEGNAETGGRHHKRGDLTVTHINGFILAWCLASGDA